MAWFWRCKYDTFSSSLQNAAFIDVLPPQMSLKKLDFESKILVKYARMLNCSVMETWVKYCVHIHFGLPVDSELMRAFSLTKAENVDEELKLLQQTLEEHGIHELLEETRISMRKWNDAPQAPLSRKGRP
jgi:hypothetical protein